MEQRFVFTLSGRRLVLESERDRLAQEQVRLAVAVELGVERAEAARAKLEQALQRLERIRAEITAGPVVDLLGCDLRNLSMHRRHELERTVHAREEVAGAERQLALARKKLEAHRALQEANLVALEALKRLEERQRHVHAVRRESVLEDQLDDAALLRRARRHGGQG